MTTRGLRNIWRYALVPLAFVCLFVANTGSATAHAHLVESTPLSGSALAEMPGEFVLQFSEPVAPTSITLALEDESGNQLGLGSIQIDDDDHRLRVAIDNSFPDDGTLQLKWSVKSASDGHDSAGLVAFTVGTGRAPLNVIAANGEHDAWWQIFVRMVWLLALVAIAARLVSNFGVGSRPGAALAILAGCASLLAAILIARPWSDVGWETSSVRLQLLAGGVSLLAALVSTRRSNGTIGIAIALWIAAVTFLSASGHAAGVERSGFATTALAIHSALALLWLGTLTALVANPPTEAFPCFVSRYSRIVVWGVVALAVAGVIFAPFQIADQRSISESTYGRTLLVKLAIVLLAVAIAATNRFVVRPLVTSGASTGIIRQARLAMGAELVALSVVVCLTAVLSATAPPGKQTIVQVASPVRHVDQSASVNDLTIGLSASITATVDDQFRITVSPATGPGVIQRVIVSTTYQDPQSGGIVPGERFDAEPDLASRGTFRFSALHLSQLAPWMLEVTVRRSGLLDTATTFAVDASAWQAEQPRISEREWQWPVIPIGAWGLLGFAILVPAIGMTIIRRNGQVAPLSGAILIIAMTMITAGFAIQAWQRSAIRTSGHELVAPANPDLLSAQVNYDALCLACHGPGAAGIDDVDPQHQHGSGTNLVDSRSRALSDGDVYTMLTSGVAGTDMPAYDVALTDKERWDLVAFLRQMQSNPPKPAITPSPW
jgi:copper transport protein